MKRTVITMILATVLTIGTGMTTYAADNSVLGAQVISHEHYAAVGDDIYVIKYSNGMWVEKINMPLRHECFDRKYWILRTDYSDGLIDADYNGIDDRDPYNKCGFTDLNYNGIADGAPTITSDWAPETEPTFAYAICEHGVIAGTTICQHPNCEAFRESMKHIHII